jgi:hypothetical protein
MQIIVMASINYKPAETELYMTTNSNQQNTMTKDWGFTATFVYMVD